MARYIIPKPDLYGLYHLSAEPISKYDLLSLVADIYDKKINILRCAEPVIDRSLSSQRFRAVTGYRPPDWTALLQGLREFYNR